MAIGNKRRSSQSLSKRPLDLPAGTVHAFAGTSAPEGWAMCDGSEVSRTDYAALFAVISTTYGVGDGLDTFNLPDMRGQFLRALDDMGTAQGAAGVDADGTARTVGQTQGNATATNGLSVNNDSSLDGSFYVHGDGASVTTGNFSKTIDVIQNTWGSGGGDTDRITFNGNHNHGMSSTDSETRPTNMGINYIIKL
jgi:microcystin-dependent protein